MNLLIENCTVVPMTGSGERHFSGTVGVCDRRIALVARTDEGEELARRVERFTRECGGKMRRIDGQGMVLMPGLVNIHGHAAMSLMRGYADDVPLMRWLHDYIWPFEAGLTPEAVRLGTQLSVAEMLAGGTTTFADMYWMEASVAQAVEEGGIRAVLCPTFIDARFGDFEEDLELVMNRFANSPDSRIGAMIAPHAPYSCSEEHIRRAVELSRRYGVGLTTHVAETRDEVDEIRRRYGKTPVEHLRDLDFFTRPSIAVHTVHLTEGDIEIFAHFGVSVAHNPQSNMKLASGIAPVARMMHAGINVGLGTDGPCSNNDLDMWEEMRSAALLQKVATGDPTVLPAYEALKMATVNGARALGMDDRIGTIEEGMLADLILVDTRKPHLQPCHDVIANLAYAAKASDVALTIVDGRIVAENGRCLTLDADAIRRAAQDYIDHRE